MRIVATPAALAEVAAREVTRAVREGLSRREVSSVALAGGSTPRGLYERLSDEPFSRQIDWSRLHLFWGDERCVPPGDRASNYGMARDALLSRVLIPEASVHRIRGELEPAQAAADYTAELRRFTGGSLPRFDLVVLGIGGDGHTASLFPDTPNLVGEPRWVVSTTSPQPPRNRVSLTLRVLNAARAVLFLVQGDDKAGVLRRLAAAGQDESEDVLPAALVQPREGALLWLVDRAAARELRTEPGR